VRDLSGDETFQFTFQILVAALEGALENQLADLVLTVKDSDDARALVQLVANVDTKANIPDEGHLKIEGAQEAPPAMLGIILAGIARLAMRRRS
jgi:hypothetical protein